MDSTSSYPPDLKSIKRILSEQRIETPSWAYGNSGTRFKVFHQPGIPRNPFEKIDDAATVHRFTGVAPSIALHIPWDQVDDYQELAEYAESQGISIGAINPNLFQDDSYPLGSICNPNPHIRMKAVEQIVESIEIARTVASPALSLWLADGTNYAGQDSMADRQLRMREALHQVYEALPDGMRLLLEYKFFEPGFYHTDIPDWGTSYALCSDLGDKATVLVDTGHHAPGTNIEFIVALLLSRGMLGGFHFNSRNYADDDLMVGAADPFELFLIMNEIVEAGTKAADVLFMLDQSHNIEPKIPALIRSVMNVQEATAKALLVDREDLHRAQSEGDLLGSHGILMDAYSTDVRPLLETVRVDMGLDPEPLEAFARSKYQEKVNQERVGGEAMSWT